jgi:hypothetical protein
MSHFSEWIEGWARVPESALGEGSPGHTCGIAYCRRLDEVIVLARSNPAVHRFDKHGHLVTSWGHKDLLDGHGLTLVETEEEEPRIWLTDRGSGLVGQFSLDGELLMTLPKPPTHPEDRPYKPTWVAVGPNTGDLWLADGYGAKLLHRFDASGEFMETRDGTEDGGLGKFACPHGIAFRVLAGRTELYLTDRGAGRIRVYDEQGQFLRALEGVTSSPCSFAFLGDWMAVPELKTGVKFFCRDEFTEEIGPNAWAQAGYPEDSKPEDPEERVPWKFLCPHDACFGPDGALYVAELNDTGRIIKLNPRK